MHILVGLLIDKSMSTILHQVLKERKKIKGKGRLSSNMSVHLIFIIIDILDRLIGMIIE